MTPTLSKAKALAEVEVLFRLIDGFGYSNEVARHQYDCALMNIQSGGGLNDSYFNEKLAKLRHWGVIGFSTRKFANVNGGLQQVQASAYAQLDTLRSLIQQGWPDDGNAT